MEIYQVGGSVRDVLLGLKPRDYDYVVVNSNPREMKTKGFKQVGADFPVFLHPETKEEYALARTEKKEDVGYCGFSSSWENVTLVQDLARRDLTINAMARDNDTLIDPFGGLQDLEAKILRHTTDAFAEDPVRVLRVGRFLARYGDDWEVAPETYALCQKIAWSEFKSLTAERVWLETVKALSEPNPWLYFEFLYMLDTVWFKELFDLRGIPQPIKHHPENCTFKHTMMVLKQGVVQGANTVELFAMLCHDLGKAECWDLRGNLHGHEDTGVAHVESFCDKLKVPNEYRELAVKVCKWHQYSHKILDVQPKKVHKLFVGLDLFRKPELLDSFNICNIADARGRLGFESREYKQADYLTECLKAIKFVDKKSISNECITKGLSGKQIGEHVRIAEINAIRGVKNKWKMKS